MSQHPHPLFVLDTNVFIGANNTYYAPDICQGFWECISRYYCAGRLLSIDRVRDEILKPEVLVQWVKAAPDGLFVFTGEQQVTDTYRNIMLWVHQNPQFRTEAKREFAGKADGWLVAYAQAHNMEVVTHEMFQPEAKGKVPLPNVCWQFNVPYLNTFEMLRQLGVQFDLRCTQ